MKARESGRIVSAAVIVAVGVNSDGRREVLGMDIGPSEAETFWTELSRKLARRVLAQDQRQRGPERSISCTRRKWSASARERRIGHTSSG